MRKKMVAPPPWLPLPLLRRGEDARKIRKFRRSRIFREPSLCMLESLNLQRGLASHKARFDIDLSQDHVLEAVDNSLKTIFKLQRHKLHKQYLSIPDGLDKREDPHKSVTQQEWDVLCIWFGSYELKAMSSRNKKNHQIQKVNHRGGCKAFLRHKFEQEKMVEIRSQPVEEGLSVLTDGEIVEKVLGTRSGYVLGLGHGEVAPSRKHGVAHNQQEVNALRIMAVEAESRLGELQAWKEAQEEISNAQQQMMKEQQEMIDAQKKKQEEQDKFLNFLKI